MHGLPMGWCNTPALFQARIQQEALLPLDLFCSEGTGACQWIDDTLLYSDDVDDAFVALERLFAKLIEKNLKINITKCCFFKTEVEICGRCLKSGGTWTFEDKFWKRISRIPPPTTTTELAQVIYICQWVSTCIPQFSEFREYFERITGPLNISKSKLKKRERIIEWDEHRLRF